MDTRLNGRDVSTITGVFASSDDAENAYQLLMELGYDPGEVTLIMSDETGEKLRRRNNKDARPVSGRKEKSHRNEIDSYISAVVDSLGKFVALPGVTLMVAGDLKDGGVRALTNSVMSDKYGEFYQAVVRDGEIVINFTPHSSREKNIVVTLWEDYRGFPVVRRPANVA